MTKILDTFHVLRIARPSCRTALLWWVTTIRWRLCASTAACGYCGVQGGVLFRDLSSPGWAPCLLEALWTSRDTRSRPARQDTLDCSYFWSYFTTTRDTRLLSRSSWVGQPQEPSHLRNRRQRFLPAADLMETTWSRSPSASRDCQYNDTVI